MTAYVGQQFRAKSLVPGVPDLIVLFKGIQETGFEEFPPFPLYDIMADIPGHPALSTVGRDTIEECGFVLPEEAP